ncbi:MAG: aminotransferase class V-fold PLP-dependent enzyme [Planctomycetota bacterium]
MHDDSFIYLDNAATSWPKPPAVARAMAEFLEQSAGNPGRGGHLLARRAATVVEETREALAGLVKATDTRRMVLTHGCTDSVNIAIHGTLGFRMRCAPDVKPSVVVSAIEHNAVLRTVSCYANEGRVEMRVVPCDEVGRVDPQAMLDACTECTALVCLSHASNALGTFQDVETVGRGLREVAPHALFLVDAAQTIGHVEFDVEAAGVDLLSIAGHKGLLGPTGTGGLYVGERAYSEEPDAPKLFCMRRGGTGIAAPGTEMPTVLPDALEAGTANAVGFAGLLAGIASKRPQHHDNEMRQTRRLIEALDAMPGVTRYGLDANEERTAVVLFNIEGHHPREVADILDKRHSIAVRGGTHCAPIAHEAIGTGEAGAVRASPGVGTSDQETNTLVRAVEQIAAAKTTA